jgi:hypothetical protein
MVPQRIIMNKSRIYTLYFPFEFFFCLSLGAIQSFHCFGLVYPLSLILPPSNRSCIFLRHLLGIYLALPYLALD